MDENNSSVNQRLNYLNSLAPDKRALMLQKLREKQVNKVPSPPITSKPIPLEIIAPPATSDEATPDHNIIITATFTAEPLKEALQFWMEKLNISTQLEFISYNQVFQQLLDPTSQLSRNELGFNIILLRLEDWQRRSENREDNNMLHPMALKTIERNIQDLILVLKTALTRTTTPFLLCLCPASAALATHPNIKEFFTQMANEIQTELAPLPGIYIITEEQLNHYYPVAEYDDPHTNRLGHIPYTPEFFAALATMLARRIHVLIRPPRKVIVLDCDQTLWDGVCGEDGALGVKFTPPFIKLQSFMLQQYEQGMLLCLCSKNNAEDVWEVFSQRTDEMVLKQDHLTNWRINWQTKPNNLRALAQELRLGLDSFIFVDNDPIECAQVQARYPEVFTLCLPANTATIPHFLDHVWAFDHLNLTEMDRQRTIFYQQDMQREHLQQTAPTLQDFLHSLNLKITIQPCQPSQLARAAQLTQRTNQFNFTTIRRSELELQQLCQTANYHCWIVEASDRFGDYGLVGLMIFSAQEQLIKLDTFLLSCRALGKGLEFEMIAQLGAYAQSQQLLEVEIPFVTSIKNNPAADFLTAIGAKYLVATNAGQMLYRLPSTYAAQVRYNPTEKASIQRQTLASLSTGQLILVAAAQDSAIIFNEIANNFTTIEQVIQALNEIKRQRAPQIITTNYVPPLNQIEKGVAKIWAESLGLEQVGVNDNFFDIGGHSLLAVEIAAKLTKEFNVEIPVVDLFEKPTVSTLAALLSSVMSKQAAPTPELESEEQEDNVDQLMAESLARGKRRQQRFSPR